MGYKLSKRKDGAAKPHMVKEYTTILKNGRVTLKEIKEVELPGWNKMDSAEYAGKIIRELTRLNEEAVENVYAFFVDNTLKVKGYSLISRGTLDMTLLKAREIVTMALLTNSKGVILSHNHPSGNMTPSRGDMSVTAKISRALCYFDIVLHDHFIIGQGESYCSMRSQGAYEPEYIGGSLIENK